MYNAQKSAIFLLALCKSAHIQKYGLTKIAEIIKREFQILENEGLVIDGFDRKVYASLACIAGDNLNSHIIGGFSASFSPNVSCPCQYCMVSNTELQEVICTDDLLLRTKSSYDEQVLEVKQVCEKASLYGIRYRSPFNSESYHVVDGLPPDIMHDMLEGVIPFELTLVLRTLTEHKCLHLEELNNKLVSWN